MTLFSRDGAKLPETESRGFKYELQIQVLIANGTASHVGYCVVLGSAAGISYLMIVNDCWIMG